MTSIDLQRTYVKKLGDVGVTKRPSGVVIGILAMPNIIGVYNNRNELIPVYTVSGYGKRQGTIFNTLTYVAIKRVDNNETVKATQHVLSLSTTYGEGFSANSYALIAG